MRREKGGDEPQKTRNTQKRQKSAGNSSTQQIKNPATHWESRGYNWSEQGDSNPRPTGPKPVALPSCAMLRVAALNIARSC